MGNSIYNFEMTYEKDIIHKYERDIVADGICDSFIPASFFREEDKLKVIYNYDGYVRISECRFREIIQLLNLIDRVILNIEKAMDCFIDINRISFTSDTVFYNQQTEDVRMAFMVSDDGMNFNERTERFIGSLYNVYDGPGTDCLDRLRSYIRTGNRSFDDIKRETSYIRREVIKTGKL